MRAVRRIGAWLFVVFVATASVAGQNATAVTSKADLVKAIDALGAFDFTARMTAARTVRRAAASDAVPALVNTVKESKDSYVPYKALVILAGFNDPGTGALMQSVMTDRNDRLRAVAYQWFEHHPSASVLPAMIDALPRETSEFVRPALTRAISASDTPAAHAALAPLITSGEDFFRGEVIEALGDYRRAWAAPQVLAVAKLDGPLQDDAVMALGKMGDTSVLPALAELQRDVPRERQPSLAAAICLLGKNCDGHHKFLSDTLKFAADNSGYQPLLRSTTRALAALAAHGDQAAFASLFDAGIGTPDAVRSPIALALGSAAIRNPAALMTALAARKDRAASLDLMRDAFDMLEEDFEEELFYAEIRRIYWASPDGSASRVLAEALIQKLEF